MDKPSCKEHYVADACPHFDQINDVKPSAAGCEDCIRIGSTWNELRLCLTCGHVGCCDDSEHQHATKHFHATAHPLIKSFDPGESWGWCYVDKRLFDRMPGRHGGKGGSFFRRLFAR